MMRAWKGRGPYYLLLCWSRRHVVHLPSPLSLSLPPFQLPGLPPMVVLFLCRRPNSGGFSPIQIPELSTHPACWPVPKHRRKDHSTSEPIELYIRSKERGSYSCFCFCFCNNTARQLIRFTAACCSRATRPHSGRSACARTYRSALQIESARTPSCALGIGRRCLNAA